MNRNLQFFLLSILAVVAVNLSAQTYNGGVWYSLYDATERTLKTSTWFKDKEIYNYTNIFTPSTGLLSFDTKMTMHMNVTNPDSYQLSVNGTTIDVPAKQTSYLTCTTNVPTDVTSVSFVYIFSSYNSERTLSIANVKLPLAQHILLADDNKLDFSKQLVGEQPQAKVVNLRSFLSAGDITISSDNPAFRVGSADNTETLVWAVGANACASPNGADGALAGGETLGDIDQYSVAIYFCPDYVKDYQGTITITDGVSTATISVTGVGYVEEQWAQEIIWDLDTLQMTVGDTLRLNAVATSGLEVGYSLNNADVCALENNMLIALAAGEIIVTATQEGNVLYLPAEEVTCTITVVPAEDDGEDGDDVTSDLEDMFAEQVKAIKIIRDGKIYIIRGNQVYDMLGTRL